MSKYTFEAIYGNFLGCYLDKNTKKFTDAVISVSTNLVYRGQMFALPNEGLFKRLNIVPNNVTRENRMSPITTLVPERLKHQLASHGAFSPNELEGYRVKFTMTDIPATHIDTPFIVYTVLVIASKETLHPKFLECACEVKGYQFAFRCAASDMNECSSIRFGMKSWETKLNAVSEPIVMKGKRISLETARHLNLIPHVPLGIIRYSHNVSDILFNLGNFYIDGAEDVHAITDSGISLQAVRKEIKQVSTASIDLDTTPVTRTRGRTNSSFSLEL